MLGRDMSIFHILHDLQEQLMHRPGGRDDGRHLWDVDGISTWVQARGAGAGAAGLACPSLCRAPRAAAHLLPQGLVRTPRSWARRDPHMSPPGTKANCVLPLLTTSKSQAIFSPFCWFLDSHKFTSFKGRRRRSCIQ